MNKASRAVFLSYASEDAEPARRICEALRAAAIEVWFDQNELRGGDRWDETIRHQIRDCALFLPIISRNTASRLEGYFRLEWKLAVDRSHLMAEEKRFLLPIVIDAIEEPNAHVPDRFKEVQWTRLLGGETPATFVERIGRLLEPDATLGDDRAQAPSSSLHNGPTRRAWGRAPLIALALAVIAIAIAIGYWSFRRNQSPSPPSAPVNRAAAPAASEIPLKSVAVLPFLNMSSDKEQEYFSDGLSEELIGMLSNVPDLRVPARTSSFYFKGKNETIETIAKQLKVANLLEGSVRKSGNRIRVTAQLIRADNGYHLWSEIYDRDAKDIFKVQDEIAEAVVSALKATLAPAQKFASRRTTNSEAYNQYLLGRQFHGRGNTDGWRRAIEAFKKAIALDPNYAAAFAELAISESFLADETGDSALQSQASADAERAIALGPEYADGYAARGFQRSSFGWDWAGAQADQAKALALDPASTRVQINYAGLMASLGRLPEAIAADKQAIEVDPLSSVAWETLGRYQMYDGDYAAAEASLRRALEIRPESSFVLANLVTLQLLQGKAADALATAHTIDDEAFRLTDIAMAQHSLGNTMESQRALDELVAKDAKDSAYEIALAYAWRGDKDQAFKWLDRAYKQRDGGLSDVKIETPLRSLRSDPRYESLLRKMDLPQ